MAEQTYCNKCGNLKKSDDFYMTNNKEKYPSGRLTMCKQCATMHVDNWDSSTYLWLLQECDVPYLPDEWNKLLATYAKDPSKVTGSTIFGRYLAKMKLKQFKEYRWKDTQFLQDLANKKIEDAMKNQGFGAAEITERLEKNNSRYVGLSEDGSVEIPEYDDYEQNLAAPASVQPTDDYFGTQTDDFEDDLTEEDKTYLRLKWGKAYRPEQWVKLEQLYNNMMQSYDIFSAGHIDTLKLICKTSLKCNELIDACDIEGYQKMSKVYNDLMKSGKFQAIQNKQENGEAVDSIGELIEMCEKEGYIERFYIEKPNDKVDFTIKDMQRYTKTLVEHETNLAEMIDQALKANAKEDEDALNSTETEIVDDIDELEKQLEDRDYEDFQDFLDEESADTLKMLLEPQEDDS